ncbi:unnamed protein product [Dibothriocephalus latus]|uniref:SH3 domain-containing protein n=1 Tax=Dibothriocephalus latus TaxID=60516 RepID=A0A3P6T579_DIBLA|nr:unnamed protein product [Dibothriocephalus latus]
MTPFAIAIKGYYPRKPGDVEVNVNDHLCLLSRVDSSHYQVLNKQTKCQGRVPAEVLSIMVDLPADNMSTNGPMNPPSSPTVKPPGPAPPLAAIRDLAWLIVENSEAWVNGEKTLPVRDGEVLRWIDYEEDVLYGDAVLDKDAFVECEKWTGEGVVLPAACVRVLSDKLELAACLSKRPRAQLIADHTSKKPEELLLKVLFFWIFCLILVSL